MENPKLVDLYNKIDFQHEVKIVTIKQKEQTFPNSMTLYRINASNEVKINYLDFLLKNKLNGLTIVFVNSIESAKSVTSVLKFLDYNVTNMHSHMKQIQRFKKIEKFRKESKQSVLVTTDVASRGIDIDNVNNVIHYHLPKDLDTFIHRSGRTARNNKEGTVYILCSAEDSKSLSKYSFEIKNMHYITFQPSEIFKREEIVKQAKKLEK